MNADDCEACADARGNPKSGIYISFCKGCAARSLAQSPDFAESRKKMVITSRYRHALASLFGESESEILAGHKRVREWADTLEAAR